MCKESATADEVHAAMPHPVVGSAADPIALELQRRGHTVVAPPNPLRGLTASTSNNTARARRWGMP